MNALLLWTCGLLLIAGVHGLDRFPEHFVVAKPNNVDPVTLTCQTQSDDAVTWKFLRQTTLEDVTLGGNISQNGAHLVVSNVDGTMQGEYSCWRGGAKISSTYLFQEGEEEEEEEEFGSFHCRAKSYHCHFGCDWTPADSQPSAVRFGLGTDCREDRKSCQWVDSDSSFHAELNHSLSPYAEENAPLEVTVQVLHDLDGSFYFFRTSKSFYLRDIVKPDSPEIVRCEEEQEELNVTVAAPSSWSTPHSYFSLQHEVEYVLRDDGRTLNSSLDSWVMLPKGISRVRARSRDSLVQSQWSEWSGWKNVRTGRITKRKNTKSAHPTKKGAKKKNKKTLNRNMHCKRKGTVGKYSI